MLWVKDPGCSMLGPQTGCVSRHSLSAPPRRGTKLSLPKDEQFPPPATSHPLALFYSCPQTTDSRNLAFSDTSPRKWYPHIDTTVPTNSFISPEQSPSSNAPSVMRVTSGRVFSLAMEWIPHCIGWQETNDCPNSLPG